MVAVELFKQEQVVQQTLAAEQVVVQTGVQVQVLVMPQVALVW